MKIAYIDCASGISGDMFLAAFLDAGLSLDVLRKELRKLPLKGYRLKVSKLKRAHIKAAKFDVLTESAKNQKHSSAEGIIDMIRRSKISPRAKDVAVRIFKNLERAEAKIHLPRSGVHLHELGDTDSIIDIVGAGVAVEAFGLEEIFFSPVPFGRGAVKTRTGLVPLPNPAAVELLRGSTVEFTDIESELVTPTGAAIIKTLGKESQHAPPMKIENVGYGAGARDLRHLPNVLRVIIGSSKRSYLKDSVYVLETAIDDMSPVLYGNVLQRLFEAGALDAYITAVYMKKQRPGHLLTVIAEKKKLEDIAEVIFRESTALGVRFYEADRFKLEREFDKVKTKYGDVDIKIAKIGGSIYNKMPEYETLKRRAKAARAPLKELYGTAMKKILKTIFLMIGLTAFLNASFCLADSVYLKSGKLLKGVVVEEYKDRLTLSTADGEIEIKKDEIDKIAYDETERNLVALADTYKSRGQLYEAYAYYSRAYKMNPELTEAKDGMFFVSGYLFRKIGADKERAVKRHQEIEDRFKQKRAEKPPTERLAHEIGIELELTGKDVKVAAVKTGTPAHEAGIKEGDLMVAVWGKLTGYMQLGDIVNLLLQSEVGEVRILIERGYSIELRNEKLKPYSDLIDARFAMKIDGLTLAEVRKDGLSYKKGLRDEDLIVNIDKKSTRYMPLKNAVKIVESKRGKTLDFVVRREVVVWKREKES